MIKVFLFDYFDVVRADSFHAWLKKYGYTREDEPGEISRRMDKGEIDVSQFIAELAEFNNQSSAEVTAELESFRVVNQDVVKLIRDLKAKYRVALISNADAVFLRKELQERGLTELFDEIFISSELGMIKPEPEIFEYATSKLEVQPHEVILVDDQAKNVDAAAKLGIKGVVFDGIDSLRLKLRELIDD